MIHLQKHDFDKLESYFKNYNQMKSELESSPTETNKRLSRIQDIVTAIDEIKKEEPLAKQIIEMSWEKKIDDELTAEVLNISKRKLNTIKQNVLKMLADKIAFY